MITYVLIFAITLPMLVGILSVDINGNEFSIIEYIVGAKKSSNLDISFMANFTTVPSLDQQYSIGEEPIDDEPVQVIEFNLPEELNELLRMISNTIIFVGLHAREFGVFLGESTAPFHYILAFVVVFVFFYPTMWLFIYAWFYIVIKERKEVWYIIRSGFKDAEIRRTLSLSVHEVINEVKRKLKRK